MLDSDHDLLTMLPSELAAAYVTSYDDPEALNQNFAYSTLLIPGVLLISKDKLRYIQAYSSFLKISSGTILLSDASGEMIQRMIFHITDF